ncbi:reverse transcriptase domain-containing protein [Tanacetum coccineum]
MRTRSSSNLIAESSTTPKRRNRRRSKQRVEPFSLEEALVVTMADQRTMAELLQAPTEGYGDAIIIPATLTEYFELKHGLLNLVTSKQFCGFEKEDPHAHIRWFNKITSMIKYRDLVSKFINQFFPPSKTTNLRNEITNFQQLFDESFCGAWDRFKDLLRACPHQSFTELHQLDTFYNALTPTDQDSLNAAAGGNLLTKTPRDALTIIENKSKVRNSRNKPIVSKVSTNAPSSSTPHSPEIAALVDAVKAMLHQKSSPPASVKAVEEICVTCGGPHPYHQCLATDGNVFPEYRDNIQGYVSAAAVNYNQGNTGYRPQIVASQIRPPGLVNRIGISYDGPPIPPLPKVVEREPEVTKDTVQPSTENIQPPVVQIQAPIDEPVVAPKPKPSIPYPSRANKQKFHEKDDNLASKFVEIFRELHIELSFADALLHMPKFASMFKSLLNNKEKLFALAKTPVNKNCSAVILKKLSEKLINPDKFLIPCDFPELVECLALADLGASINLMPLSIWKKLSLLELTPTQMILKLADRSTTSPSGIAEVVFVKVGKFHFPADFVVVDYVVDPRVPLILGRPFLRTARALIDVYGEELTLRVDDEAITFKVGQTSRYSYNDAVSINRIDVIDVACEEYAQEVYFILEKSKACLTNDSILPGIDDADFDPEGDLLLLEKHVPKVHDGHFPRHDRGNNGGLYGRFLGLRGFFLLMPLPFRQNAQPSGIEVDKAKVDVIAKLPHPTSVKGIQIFLGHVGFYRRFIQDFSKIARPMTHLFEKDTPFIFLKECIESFDILKKKLIEAPILVASDWDLPFEIMCDASDYAVGAVLGQRKTKHFQPIHFASKTMTDAQAHYTTTEKELLAVVYAFEKFQPYLVLSKTIVYTDHSALKYLLAKQDAKLRLLRWILLLQELDVIIRDKKGAENLAADHLSRLENPYQDVLENKEIT